jgi:alkanesulfonate monooxygenase SsuD/methylene tetrahydromethanopterin reductase-like flavin-dependent oxidoreductase (luciferase family)
VATPPSSIIDRSAPSTCSRLKRGRGPGREVFSVGVDAERLGFRRVFLSERWDIKQADVILAGIGAKTTRLELATGIIVPTTRHRWMVAALGATMQSCFGPRFVLGLGRGENLAFRGMGIEMTRFDALVESAKTTRRLCRLPALSGCRCAAR